MMTPDTLLLSLLAEKQGQVLERDDAVAERDNRIAELEEENTQLRDFIQQQAEDTAHAAAENVAGGDSPAKTQPKRSTTSAGSAKAEASK